MVDIRLGPSATRAPVEPIRVTLTVLSLATFVYALGVVVFGIVSLITQLAAGVIQPTMYWRAGQYSFESYGYEHSAVRIAGAGGSTVTTVTGMTTSTVAIYVAATVVGMLTQAALGFLAARLLVRLRAGQPFRNAAWREVAAVSGVVLILGFATQLLAWWTRVSVISDAKGSGAFSTGFVFEPLTVTIGLALALVALAFRFGERLQRDADGLV